MTVLDAKWEFCDDQDIAASSLSSGSSIDSEDVVDLGATHETAFRTANTSLIMGYEANKLTLMVQVGSEAFAGGTTTAQLYTHTSATSLKSGTAIGEAISITTGAAVNSIEARFQLPMATYKRYLGFSFLASGGAITAGKLNAYLMMGAAENID